MTTAWGYILSNSGRIILGATPIGVYAYYYRVATEMRTDKFKNKSRLFGGLKNPQH